MTGLVSGGGHLIVPVEEMGAALRFYRDLLGFPVKGSVDRVWTELDAGGFPLTLYVSGSASRVAIGPKRNDTPIVFHVENYLEAERFLKEKGLRVHREGAHQGVVWDPFGNVIRLHDHRKV